MGTGARRGHSKSQRVKRGSKWTKEDMAESRGAQNGYTGSGPAVLKKVQLSG